MRVHECKQQALSSLSLAREAHCLQNWRWALVHWQMPHVWSSLALHVS